MLSAILIVFGVCTVVFGVPTILDFLETRKLALEMAAEGKFEIPKPVTPRFVYGQTVRVFIKREFFGNAVVKKLEEKTYGCVELGYHDYLEYTVEFPGGEIMKVDPCQLKKIEPIDYSSLWAAEKRDGNLSKDLYPPVTQEGLKKFKSKKKNKKVYQFDE